MTVRETGFHSRTAAAGASFVEYEGYWLPGGFSDLAEEYDACRHRAVVMDLSPLRKFEVAGPGAEALLQATMTRDIRRLTDGQVVYTAMCNEDGAVVDDGTVFRFNASTFRWIGYTDDDEAWLRSHADRLGLDVTITPSTDQLHNIAVQGPASRAILTGLVRTEPGDPAVEALSWFHFTKGRLTGEQGSAVLVSRTGYSGELGYELFCRPDDGPAIWDAVWEAGRSHGLTGLGLDALDVVRIEAGLIFKGYEYTGTEDPFEAGIGFTVTGSKQDAYVGKDALARRLANPTTRLVGLELAGGTQAGEGLPAGEVHADGETVGVITSACRSPLLGTAIALARVDVAHASVGTQLMTTLEESGSAAPATVVRIPFYDPEKSRPRS